MPLTGEREHRTCGRALQVGGDDLDVNLAPPLDELDDHEPLSATEETEGVQRGRDVGAARELGSVSGDDLLDRAGVEPGTKSAERDSDLRQISADDQVDGLERLPGHRGGA